MRGLQERVRTVEGAETTVVYHLVHSFGYIATIALLWALAY